jgi:vacuolar-type H+-ATPase subunit E/Vma4
MSFDKFESVILSEARAEAGKIIAEARAEAETSFAAFKDENEKKFEEAIHQAELAASRETTRVVGQARQEARLSVLAAKNNIIDLVFVKATNRISSMPEDEKRNLYDSWLRNMAPEIGGTIKVSPKDEMIFTDDFIKSINSSRTLSGKIDSVTVDKQISDGFTVEGSNFTADFVIEKKLNELRENYAGELAKELF